jgi:tRNA dimethylallyltransferase
MLQELNLVDPQSAGRLHANDKKRIVRALEIYNTTGMTITEHDEMTRQTPPRYDACVFALSYAERADLYNRINKRVDQMMESGLMEEVVKLIEMGLTGGHTSMQAIGYKELLGVLHGECGLLEAVELVKMESRRYAKRQLSWLRRNEQVKWILWEKEPDFDNGLAISTKNLEELGYNIAVWKQN